MIGIAERFRQEIPPIVLSVVLLVFVAMTGIESGHAQSAADANPGQWEVHTPGGKTSCADGSEFKYFTRMGNPQKLMIHFTGGGACWTGRQCNTSTDPTPYFYRVSKDMGAGNDPRYFNGIFDFDHPENPFGDYTILVAPACTGDVFLGDSAATYQFTLENGQQKSTTTYHKGYANGMATLQWAFENINEPETVIFTGSSAGAFAVPFYTNIVANHYSDARVAGIGDSINSLHQQAIKNADVSSWNLGSVFKNHLAFEQMNAQNFGIDRLYISSTSQNLPNIELYQTDHAYDNKQEYYLKLTGQEDPDILTSIRESRAKIKESDIDFQGFTIGGTAHTAFMGHHFYFYMSDGMRLSEWVADIAQNKNVQSYDCANCNKTELYYTPTDLRILNNIKESLSSAENWNPNDKYRKNHDCSAYSNKYSLRCAVKEAAESEGSIARYAIGNAILYASRARLDEQALEQTKLPAFVTFNNQSDRTYEDIMDLVQEVERDIRTQLNE